MAKSVYDIIKKQNGEGFAKVLRERNLLGIPDVAKIVQYAGNTPQDAEALAAYLWSKRVFEDVANKENKNPFELLHEAGYRAEYADSLKKQNSIQKYFKHGEELCTFHDNVRYKENYIINAVKYDVDSIKRSKKPSREDEYGTSVISIQISKKEPKISIKNRYNHTVDNPDETFNNNPDNIIPGLSASLKTYFNVNWVSPRIPLPFGWEVIDGQVVKTNFSLPNDVFIGAECYVAASKIYPLDKNSQVIMDYFIYDAKQKKLLVPSGGPDGFVDAFNSEIKDKKIILKGNSSNYSIIADDVEIVKVEDREIVSVNLPNQTRINNKFLSHNRALRELNLPNVEGVGDEVLLYNKRLNKLNMPKVQHIADWFLTNNECLSEINFPEITYIGDGFFVNNRVLVKANVPGVLSVGNNFLRMACRLKTINMPNLYQAGHSFMLYAEDLKEANFPELVEVGDCFLQNTTCKKVNLPKLYTVGDYFLAGNPKIKSLSLPSLHKAGNRFLFYNKTLRRLILPQVTSVGYDFLSRNTKIKYIDMPNLKNADMLFVRDLTIRHSLCGFENSEKAGPYQFESGFRYKREEHSKKPKYCFYRGVQNILKKIAMTDALKNESQSSHGNEL